MVKIPLGNHKKKAELIPVNYEKAAGDKTVYKGNIHFT